MEVFRTTIRVIAFRGEEPTDQVPITLQVDPYALWYLTYLWPVASTYNTRYSGRRLRYQGVGCVFLGQGSRGSG